MPTDGSCFTPTGLLCEYSEAPLDIDCSNPGFTWRMEHPERGQEQRAYQIEVCSESKSFLADQPDMWDSGKVYSNHCIGVTYNGRPLESNTTYYWRVRLWDNQGRSCVSEAAVFETGFLKPSDWQAGWIGFPGGVGGESMLARMEFTLEQPVTRARAYICGLGYYELRINGHKVGDHVLDPGWTEQTSSVLYAKYDVTQYLRPGPNAVGVMLGQGWYGNQQLILQIHMDHSDGRETVVSTGGKGWHWHVKTGPIVRNTVYDGEVYDARLEQPGWDQVAFDEVNWTYARPVAGPGGTLRAQAMEPIKVTDTIKPVALTNPQPGVHVFDLGRNFAGWASLAVEGPIGTAVHMKYAEILYDDGTVNQENLRAARCQDTYILKGEGQEAYKPRFTFHGFRYVQVEGFPGTPTLDAVMGEVVHSAVPMTGSFSCSHAMLNELHTMAVWTERSNLHSLPTDCPQRDERLGWLNDMGVRAEAAVYNFSMVKLYRKWMRDIAATQDKATGAIADTAPYRLGSLPADPVCVVYVLAPWLLYQHYGDTKVLAENYHGMKQWVDFLASQTEDGIVNYSWYGDWAPPLKKSQSPSEGSPPATPDTVKKLDAYPPNTPGGLISTACLFLGATLFAKIARVLGRFVDSSQYDLLAQRSKHALHTHFFDNELSRYARGSQGSNAFPLYFDITPPDRQAGVLADLVQNIVDNDYHLTTGNQCTKAMIEVLTRLGKGDVACRIMTQTTYPSWGYMMSLGATTVWERWEYATGPGMNSHNHPMHGAVDAWFYKYLAGITVDEKAIGWSDIVIKPHLVGDLQWAEGTMETVRGRIRSKWQRDGANGVTLEVDIPANCHATVFLPVVDGPSCQVREGGHSLFAQGDFVPGLAGIGGARLEGDWIRMEVGSGSYCFAVCPL